MLTSTIFVGIVSVQYDHNSDPNKDLGNGYEDYPNSYNLLSNGDSPPYIEFYFPEDGSEVSAPFILIWDAIDEGGDQVIDHQYRINDNEWTNILSPIPIVIIESDPGTIELHVRSFDPEGNVNESSLTVEVKAAEPIEWTNIHNLHDLNQIRYDLGGNYRLMNDIDASQTSDPSSEFWNDGEGFIPIGKRSLPDNLDSDDDFSEYFTGVLDGNGHSINRLFMNSTFSYDGDGNTALGLFSIIGYGAKIMNLDLNEVNITYGISDPDTANGVLAGYNMGGFIINCNSSGDLNSASLTGLIGMNFGLISDSVSTMSVNCDDGGGIVGLNVGIIENSFYDGHIEGISYIGGLAGYNVGTVQNSNSEGSVTGATAIGGLIGYNIGTIEDSHSTNDILGINALGGLAGCNEGRIINSYASGNVDGTQNVGGLIGINYEQGLVESSYAIGEVNGDERIGGLIGDNEGAIIDSYAMGTVSGDDHIGGLVGSNSGSIIESHSKGDVIADERGGGLVGWNRAGGSIESSYAFGGVIGNEVIGGLVGYNQAVLNDSYATGDVHGIFRTGGLVGYNHVGASINYSFSTGTVSGVRSTGGLVGDNSGCISKSYSVSDVCGNSSTGDRIYSLGGLVGRNDGTIQQSYFSGRVIPSTVSNTYVGGLVGYNGATVIECYSGGRVVDVNTWISGVGGLVGAWSFFHGSMTSSYWDTDKSPILRASSEGGRTTYQMLQQETYTDWDFDTVWSMTEGESYPTLQNVGSVVIRMWVHQQPVLDYNEGENLDLGSMMLSMVWSNGVVEIVPFVDFHSKGIVTYPCHGEETNDGLQNVTITHSFTGIISYSDEITITPIQNDDDYYDPDDMEVQVIYGFCATPFAMFFLIGISIITLKRV